MSQRPKVVTIWANYGPYHMARVNALEESGFEVFPYSYSNLVPSYEFFREVPPRHRLINDCPIDSVKPVVSWWRTIRHLWHDKPNLILACGYERPETLAALLYAHIIGFAWRGAPKVVLMVENQLDDRRRGYLIEGVKRLYLMLFDGFSVGGITHIDYLRHLHIDTRKICTGYNCVDNSRIASIAAMVRESETTLANCNYFFTLSRLIPKKNISLIIDAYAMYRKLLQVDKEPWQLVIAGTGPTQHTLRERVRHHNLGSSIHMVGVVDQLADAVRYYAFCKAFVLASNRSEAWGLVVNEAMAAGVPVLVSKQCGCSFDLVKNGRNGFTFDGNSVSELADRMLWLHLNEHALAQMGKESAGIVSDHSPSHFANNVGNLYRVVSSGTRRRPQAPARSGESGITPRE